MKNHSFRNKKFTELFPDDLTYDVKSRKKKANKIIAVLRKELGNTNQLKALDLGCSIGIITEILGKDFKTIVGVDVDKEAIGRAKERVKAKNVEFKTSSEKKLPFNDNSFDVVIFNQVYEHVQKPEVLVKEIYRVLKPQGACYFGARNKYFIFDGHYNLPGIAWLPKNVANYYLNIFTGKKEYDIVLYTPTQLRKLVNKFTLHDYTLKVITNPREFKAQDVIPDSPFLKPFLRLTSKVFYFLIPNYIFILRK